MVQRFNFLSDSYPEGQPSMVQCFPFQPVTHKQVPFLHCPCSLHRESHSFELQYSPPQPALHEQVSPTHFPCWPQSKSHNSLEQSSPLHLGSQLHVCVSRSKVPCDEQSGKHCNASWSMVAQSKPFQPFLQMQVPSAQKPWPEHVGCGQSTEIGAM